MTGAFSWVLTWIIMISVLVALSATRWGRPIVYYSLWLMVVILVVSRGSEVSSLINIQALQLNG